MSYAYLFPGQGSQKVGMADGFQSHPLYKEIFQQANQSLGYDLQKLCSEGPMEELTLSKNSQPAILTVSILAYRIFIEKNSLQPSFLAGHSLGEYSALVASGVLEFSEAVKIVHKRGDLMQQAVPEGVGAMAAILGQKDEDVQKLCETISREGNIVAPANFNSTGQIVVSGHKEAVTELLTKVKGMLLQVSAPFHCSLMSPIKKEFASVLSEAAWKNASIPIVNNVKNEVQTSNDSFSESLLEQIDSPVLWKSGIELMIKKGVKKFIEFGEGKVLTNLLRRIDKQAIGYTINSLESIENFKND